MPLLLGVVALPLWHPTPLQRVSPSPDVCSAPAGPKSVDCQRDLWAECRLVQVWNKTDTFLRQKGSRSTAHTPLTSLRTGDGKEDSAAGPCLPQRDGHHGASCSVLWCVAALQSLAGVPARTPGTPLPDRQWGGCPCSRGGAAGAGGAPGLLSQGHRPFLLCRSQPSRGSWNPGDLKGYLANGA